LEATPLLPRVKATPHRLTPSTARPEQSVLPQVRLPVLFEGLSAETQYFKQTYNRGESILQDTLTGFKQDKEAGLMRLKQSERLMHQFRDEKDKAVALAYAEVANAKRIANDLSVVKTRCKELSTINHRLPSQVSTLETQRTAFDRLKEGEIAELKGAKDTMDRLHEKAVWERREALETAKAREGEAQVRGMQLNRHGRLSGEKDRAAKSETLWAMTRSKSF